MSLSRRGTLWPDGHIQGPAPREHESNEMSTIEEVSNDRTRNS